MHTKGIERVEPAPLALAVRRAKVIGGITGLVLLAGCVENEERFVTAPETTLGSSVEGELTTASATNLNNGTRYAAHWLCGGGADAAGLLYELEAPFAAELSAFDAQGRWLGAAQGGPDDGPAALLVEPSGDACTLAVVSGRGNDAFGPYRLVAGEAPSAEDGTLSSGRPLLGRLEGEEKVHEFSVEEPIHLTLALSGGDAGMQLLGEGVSQSARACADGELRLETYLDAGDYRVRLKPGQAPEAVAEGERCANNVLSTGSAYRLLAEQRDLSDGMRNGGPLREGDSIAGTLEGGQPNVYSLHLEEPSEVSLSLRSRDFDTLIRVVGEGADLSNDDGGQGTDSRVDTVLMAGDYEVEVDSYGDEGGEYALNLTRRAFEGEFRNDGPLAAGESVRGQLGGLGNNQYTFSVEGDEPVEARLALESTDFDPVLRLHGNGIDVSDDDGGGDRNSLITTVLEPGRYTLEVQSYSGNGIYLLSAEQQAFEGRMADSGAVAVGDIVYGNLTPGGQLSYRLDVEGEEGESRSVTIESTSSAADTVLSLSGDGVSAENDDADGLGLGSRISRHLAPGTYDIEVRSFGSGGGMVRLEVRG